MKRTLLFFATLFVFAYSVLAEPVDPDKALQIAKQFVPQTSKGKKVQKKGDTPETSTIVYTHKMPKSNRAAFYIVNVGDGSFVLVSADDVAHQILGYSFDKSFPIAEDGTVQLPPHIKGFFDDLAAQIEAAIDAESNGSASKNVKRTNTAAHRAPSNLPESVNPLLTTTWDQGQYYNALCPNDIKGPDGHVWTGCVATAMAQIIKYWGYPVHGRGTHSYDSNYGTLSINYAESNYDFGNMPDALTSESSDAQVNAVAKLMYDCGVSANMEYGVSESGAFTQDARAALINFFRFSPDLSFAEKAFFSNDEWNELMRKNLAASQPIVYNGFGTGGHTFVLDGYKEDDYFHFNFGWGGFADGWFVTTAVNPGSSNYSSSQSAIVGIVPNNNSNIIIGQTTGTSTFTVDEPLEFYHLMGHNAYEGANYNNLCNSTITFVPANNEKQMVADIIEFEDQNIGIYDGTNNSVQMRNLTGGGENDMSPVVSTQNGITLLYTGNMYDAGFKLVLSQNSDCRMVSNIVSSVEATTVHLTWTENGSATQWQVEYGKNGFSHGKGTLETVDNNSITIENLQKFTEYVFYIRSVGANNQYGPWNQKTIMVEAPYWQDIVTSQPEGYVLNDETNTVEISTPEGFAWWAKKGCQYDAYLTRNIDLTGYKWRPVSGFTYSNLYGNGHIVSNLYINESMVDVGLFSDFSGIIDQVGVICAHITNKSSRTGSFCGTLRGIIRNSYVYNSVIDAYDNVGGLVGESRYGTVDNCFVNTNVIGNRWTGIMIGNSWQGTIRNCYSAGSLRHRSYCYMAGISAYAGAGEISNCYSVETEMGVVGYKGSTNITDTATFVRSDYGWTLLTPVYFDEVSETDLLTALNRYLEQVNDDVYCVWKQDLNNENGGYPILGEKYTIICPNVSDISIQNVKNELGNAVSLSWTEEGDATQWRIRYRRHDIPNAPYTYITTKNNPAIIRGIPLGYVYDFNIQAIRDSKHHSGWSDKQSFIVDLSYWTDIVTSQPEGYVEDSEGNIEISTAEGLAWLAVKVDGLNGQETDSFDGKTVLLTSDINLEGYRWKPIGGYYYSESKGSKDWLAFSGIFDGQNNRVSNIYINDAYSDLGLFGHARNAQIRNIIIDSGTISSIYTDSKDSHALHSSAIGGLIGYAYDCSEINNCHSSVTIHANGGAGSLCGNIHGDLCNSFVTNCSASGTVYGREACGGLVGGVYGDVIVQNCYSSGNVKISTGNDNSLYRGGLIGEFMYATAFNCYSFAKVENAQEGSSFYGKVIGCPYLNTHIHYIYGQDNVNEGWELIGDYCEDISNSTQFSHSDNINSLITPITIKGETYTDLLDALNAWVVMQNDQNLKTWKLDSNTGYPVLGDFFEPNCYNPTDLAVTNATEVGNPTIRTQLSWTQIGNPDYWEVLYVASEHDISEGVIVPVNSNCCVLTDIPIGKPLDFYVRAINNENDISDWSRHVTYIPDKLRWTEVVTSKPEGYSEDEEGNVYISSAEGLAWLSSVANGLNGNQYNSDLLYNNCIYITSDLNLSTYRWTSLGMDRTHIFYCKSFDGNFHTITGLYCNELSDCQGLFGTTTTTVSNLSLNDCTIYGENHVGAIAGEIWFGSIINSSATGNVYGISEVGGLVGRHLDYNNSEIIRNSFFSGVVMSRKDIINKVNSRGGYVGGICGSAFGDLINNCYVVSEITDDGVYSGIVTGSGSEPYSISNCYYKYYDTDLPVTSNNFSTANNSSFSGSGSTWTLNTPQYINDSFYSDLVDALNAWVDGNNSEGQYRHWVADTENKNGGYPIFAPAYTLTYKVDGEIYKTRMVEPGTALTPEAEPTKDGYVFGGWSGLPETMPDHDVEVTALFYLYGDVNADTKVNVIDVVDIARFVVETPSANFREKLADLNKDLAVNIADAVVLVNHIAGDQNFARAMEPSMQYNYDLCQLQLQSAQESAISLCLDGDADFTAFQFEVELPQGVDISALRINNQRKDGHQLLYNKVAENRYRVAALSLSNAVFKGNEGELLNIAYEGAGSEDIRIRNIHFVTANGTDVVFDDLYYNSTVTGITDFSHREKENIFDLQGRRLSKVQRGLNIVNGQKVVVK